MRNRLKGGKNTSKCSEPEIIHEFDNTHVEELNIDNGKVTVYEVCRVTRKMKNGKSAGIDGIQAELLKNGGKDMVNRLVQLCNQVWSEGVVSRDW